MINRKKAIGSNIITPKKQEKNLFFKKREMISPRKPIPNNMIIIRKNAKTCMFNYLLSKVFAPISKYLAIISRYKHPIIIAYTRTIKINCMTATLNIFFWWRKVFFDLPTRKFVHMLFSLHFYILLHLL